eukprot:gene3856-13918_t
MSVGGLAVAALLIAPAGSRCPADGASWLKPRARPFQQLLHVSKSGGTSVCQLARVAGRSNPHFNLDGNCLVEGMQSEPQWTLMPHGHELLVKTRSNFFSNEMGLQTDGFSSDPASSYACSEMHNVIGLRHPFNRVESHIKELLRACATLSTAWRLESHIKELLRVFKACATLSTAWRLESHIKELLRVFKMFASGKKCRDQMAKPSYNLGYWVEQAPAAVDNYLTRTVLGRGYLCK